MKISKVEQAALLAHCGISQPDNETLVLIELYRSAAVNYILGATGLKSDELDAYEDLTVALLCLVNDMYNSRSMTVNSSTMNPTVKQILGMHRRNFLA